MLFFETQCSSKNKWDENGPIFTLLCTNTVCCVVWMLDFVTFDDDNLRIVPEWKCLYVLFDRTSCGYTDAFNVQFWLFLTWLGPLCSFLSKILSVVSWMLESTIERICVSCMVAVSIDYLCYKEFMYCVHNCRHRLAQCDKKRQHIEAHPQAVYHVSVV